MVALSLSDSLPEGFLACEARDLSAMFAGPTLVELPGRREPPLFVSILQHGNETTGLEAVQQVLRARQGHELPRSVMLFIANVAGAAQGLRRLDGQPDYNRAWPGTEEHAGTPEAAVMRQVYDMVLARGAFAAIDLHNNTGFNPHYGVVCSDDPATLHLASLFARTAVRFRGIAGTQTASFAGRLPAIAAECGQPGIAANAAAAARFVDGVLSLSEFPARPLRNDEIDLYHTLVVVRVRKDVSFGFGDVDAQLRLDPGLDHSNFRELPAGTRFGASDNPMPLEVRDEAGRDVAGDFFTVEHGELKLARAGLPAMLSGDARVVRQDCLCYLMERVEPARSPLDHEAVAP